MKKILLNTCLVAIVATSAAQAQNAPASTPATQVNGMVGGTGGAFAGYVPSANSGMFVGGASAATSGEAAQSGALGAPVAAAQANPDRPAPGKGGIPALSDGKVVSADKVEGFNQSVEQNFPMTPEMIRKFREIYDANDRALNERAEPEAKIDTGFISLEPGQAPSEIGVAPGIATVIGFYDVTGQPWPVEQYVLGSGENFQVLQLGETSNNLALTPLQRFGWTNLIVVLKGEAKPVVMRVNISEEVAHFRHDVQIMAQGPNAVQNTAGAKVITEAGDGVLMAALAGVDLPSNAKAVRIVGVDARAWKVGEKLYIRSKHALLSPSWLGSMSGPDGVRVYEIKPGPVALFSVDGQIVRADVVLP